MRPSTIRMKHLRKAHGPTMRFTWLMYRPGYIMRGKEEVKDLLRIIKMVEPAYKVLVRWLETVEGVFDYINQERTHANKTLILGYFCHSNRYAILLYYSSEILGASKAFVHVRDLSKIFRRAFASGADIKSRDCYTGQYMSQDLRKLTSHKMWEATGKTDYAGVDEWQEPFLPSRDSRWCY
jgi:hypothetical protein